MGGRDWKVDKQTKNNICDLYRLDKREHAYNAADSVRGKE